MQRDLAEPISRTFDDGECDEEILPIRRQFGDGGDDAKFREAARPIEPTEQFLIDIEFIGVIDV